MQARVVADRKVVISAGTVLPKAGTDADILRLTGLIRTTHDPEKRAGLHVRLAKSLTTFGDHNRARAHLAQAQELTPDTPELLRLLGLAMFREGIIGDGLKSYDKGRWQIERFAKYRRAYPFDLWRGAAAGWEIFAGMGRTGYRGSDHACPRFARLGQNRRACHC
jgi:hypothetical protein